MTIDEDTGLVLEGGGMRGVFTCGVLDYLLDKKIYFNYIVGVSAGACNGMSYMSRQRGRGKFSNIDMLGKYQYIGMKYLWTQHSVLDLHLLYDELPSTILPYDFDAYFRNPATFEMVVTDCCTGQAHYLTEKRSRARVLSIVKASSSLPYVCPMVGVDGEEMLDGGIVDSIPLLHSRQVGHKKNVLVLTRNFGYRDTDKDRKIPHFIYKNYPRLRVVLSHRHKSYNQQLLMAENAENDPDTLVIRPRYPVEVDRLEKNMERLTALYEEGYECANRAFEKATLKL
jgi:predicted patatin/cPLA2 family phospholipase